MEKSEDLVWITQSGTEDHLGHAAYLLRQCAQRWESRRGITGMAGRRVAISCIVHGFCGLESMLNRIGYEVFFDPDSAQFLAEDRRTFMLRRFLRSWNTCGVADKLQAIIDVRQGEPPRPNLLSRLQELNNLRNWLVHGFVYKTTLLVEPDQDQPGVYQVMDREHSVDWRSKFSNSGFNPPGELGYSDAATALTIVFEIVECLGEVVLVVLEEPVPRAIKFEPRKDSVLNVIDKFAHG